MIATLVREWVRGPRAKPRAIPITTSPPTRTAAQAHLRAMQRADAVAQAEVIVAPVHRWNHGQDAEPAVIRHGATGVASGIRTLRHADLIGNADLAAAKRFGLDYEVGVEGAAIPSRSQRSGSADCHDVAIGRSDSITRHRLIASLLGPVATEMLVVFVVMDRSISAMQRLYQPVGAGTDDACVRTAWTVTRGRIVGLLKLLPGMYASLDRHGGPRPDQGDDAEQFGE